MRYKYNYDLNRVVEELKNPNKSLNTICKELNYNYKYVSRKLRQLGIDNSNRRVPFISKTKCMALYDDYLKGKTIELLAKENNCCKGTIRTYFKKYNLSYKFRRINSNINNTFFLNINTEEKAYLLGFFAADGTINKHGCGMALLLQARDIEILDYFNVAFNAHKRYYFYPAKKSSHQDRLKLEINSEINKNILLEKGFPCDKTHKMFALPNTCMDKSLYRHFIRGYFDGDGSIIIPNNNSRTRKFKITSSNIEFLEFCVEIFKDIGCYNIKIEKKENNLARVLYIQNKKSIAKLYHYFYDNSHFYLKRKYDKMKNVAQLVGNNFQKIDSKIGEPSWLN